MYPIPPLKKKYILVFKNNVDFIRIFKIDFVYLTCNNDKKIMMLIYKPTGQEFKVKRVRQNGKVELENGVVIPLGELELNYKLKV
jgi:hypothetical protein